MNEQRQQVYLNLIRSLLDSPSGEESEILAANQELLDAGFVQKVEEVAQMCSQHGDEKTANWLQGLAMQLREKLNLDTTVDLQSLSEEEIQAYFQFLMEILQATVDSEGDAQVVYSLLAKNTDKLDEVLAEILRQSGTNILREAQADRVEYLTADIVAFSNLIRQFPLGNKANNVEIAITGYEVALTVYTQQAFPYKWAMTQNNLGVAYSERIRGERTENLDVVITCYQNALKVYTFDAFPYEWARTQNNLGEAYRKGIKGDKANNLEKAIIAYNEALKVYTFDVFPYEWAIIQNNFAAVYIERIRGNKADNLEKAITSCQKALKVRTFEKFPQYFADTQNNLAIAYFYRIKGDKANNLEKAIIAYNEALKVYTFDAFPYEWARTQNNLANSYCERIRGDKADNLEKSIAVCQEALKVYTFDAFPYEWAMTQHNLSNVYRERIRGDKAGNLEKSIAVCQEALKVYNFNAFSYQWADTQNNLAASYRERIRGDKADNLEKSIAVCQEALKVLTFNAFPKDWAMVQNNLALAYSDRIRGNRVDNLEKAITAYIEALKVYTFDSFPYEWAMTQNNLANAYSDSDILGGYKFDNLEKAIATYAEALKVRSFDTFPYEWAMTQNNLALAYYDRVRGDRVDNLEKAIAAYTAALTVRTQEAFPQDWAATQNNLAIAYRDRIKGDKAENVEQAIAAYTEALIVRTKEAFPQDYAETLWGLGITYQDANQLNVAYNTFNSAIVTIESLRSEIVSGDESKRKQAERFNGVYNCMIQVCLQLNKTTEAIEYVERSKTRNLVEQILERDSKTIFPPEVFTQLENYRDEIAVGQYQIQNGKAENPQVLAKYLQELRRQRNELQNEYLPVGYGFNFNSFQATLNENTVIIEWYILNDKILAFIVTKQREVTVWQSQPEDQKALYDWVNQYLQNYYTQKDQWLNNLGASLQELAAILHIDEILTQIPKHCNQLILIPHRYLHLFPLHALPVKKQGSREQGAGSNGEKPATNSESSSCLLDLFAGGVSYAPSCQLLQQVQQRKRPDFQSLFAIQNPTGDLNYTDLEVQVIQSYFNTANVLKRTDATLTAINNSDLNTYHCAHFSCHGYFDLTNAGKSALILANAPTADTPTKADSERYLNVRAGETHDLEKCLTLDKILALQLEKCRLVTLSACETGLIDYRNISDEYIGLPSGFLLAGSRAVVSSLWTVSDLSTAFLMMKFYENLQKINSVSLALNQAQQWLRNLTTEEFEALLIKYQPQIEEIFAQLPEEKRPVARAILKRTCKRKPHPFAAAFYWAGFTATGL
ncbi:tetratricopeptide repeat protein [Nostocales cyanobacterium LEGE 12452]|nr:tetratricopeptide repeat protein [Nostocales cyanobacterium LEGE 12452]